MINRHRWALFLVGVSILILLFWIQSAADQLDSEDIVLTQDHAQFGMRYDWHWS